ncbi:MAG: zinc-dependent metalloprotease, partial [Planctomycetota bacterium]
DGTNRAVAKGSGRVPLVPTDAAKQRTALAFVCDEILSGKYFDFEPAILAKLAPDFWGDDWQALITEGHVYPYLDNVLRVQTSLIYSLTDPDRLTRVLGARAKTPMGQDVLTAPDVFDSLEATIFGGLEAAVSRPSTNQRPALTAMQRNLPREYVGHLIYMLLEGEKWYPASIQTLCRHYVKRLGDKIRNTLEGGNGLDTYTLAHLEECHARLTRALEASYELN